MRYKVTHHSQLTGDGRRFNPSLTLNLLSFGKLGLYHVTYMGLGNDRTQCHPNQLTFTAMKEEQSNT